MTVRTAHPRTLPLWALVVGLAAGLVTLPPSAAASDPNAPAQEGAPPAEGIAPVGGAPAEKPKEAPPAAPAEAVAPVPEGVVLKSFQFEGNTAISTPDLDALTAEFVGQACDINRLRAATDKITAEYSRRGFTLAKAYLPAQDIQGGIVQIRILEGVLGDIHVEGNKYYSDAFIKGFLTKALTEKGAVTHRALERALLILNTEFSGITATATLERGAEAGKVDVRVVVKEKFPLHATLSYDNFGSEFVSRNRFGLQVDYTNAVIQGGQLTARGIIGNDPQNLSYGSLGYSLPVNECGTKVGITGSYGDFEVGQEFGDLGINGQSMAIDVYGTHPYIKTREMNLSLEAGLTVKDTELFLLDEMTSNDEIRTLRVGAHFDSICWKGKNVASLFLTQGTGEFLGGSPENSLEASRRNADNSFTKVVLNYARIQPLNESISFLVRAVGQVTSDSLVASEEFSMGGADTVRGYPQGEFGGDNGYLISVEARYAPFNDKEVCQFVLFLDHAGASRISTLVGQRDFNSLTGAGFGARLNLPYNTDLRVDLGFPIEPSNSTDESPVIYVAGSIRF